VSEGAAGRADSARAWARVGLLIPSSNTVMEVDFYRRLPTYATLHTGRMYMEDTTPEGEAEMLDVYALPAARDVGTAKPDVLVFGCTSGGALRGNDYDRKLCERIGEETGSRVISVIASVREAVGRRAAARVGVVTPYVEELNDKIRASLEEDGVEVPVIRGLGITENFAIAKVEPEQVADFAARSLEEVDVDLVFVSCTNLRALDAMPVIEHRLGLPVVTSNSAALETTLVALGEAAGRASAAEGPRTAGERPTQG
jgi:maleate isomerase